MTYPILGEDEELALQPKEVTPNWKVMDWDSNHSNLHHCSLPLLKYISLSSLIQERS